MLFFDCLYKSFFFCCWQWSINVQRLPTTSLDPWYVLQLVHKSLSCNTMQSTGLWYNFLGNRLLGSISSRLMLQGITCEMTFSEQVSIFNPQHKFKVVILFNISDTETFLTERKKHLYREWYLVIATLK